MGSERVKNDAGQPTVEPGAAGMRNGALVVVAAVVLAVVARRLVSGHSGPAAEGRVAPAARDTTGTLAVRLPVADDPALTTIGRSSPIGLGPPHTSRN